MDLDNQYINNKLTALISCYSDMYDIKKVELSITYPKSKTIVTHKSWHKDFDIDMSKITDEIMDLCKKNKVKVILQLDMPLSEVLNEKCPHCGQQAVRVLWT